MWFFRDLIINFPALLNVRTNKQTVSLCLLPSLSFVRVVGRGSSPTCLRPARGLGGWQSRPNPLLFLSPARYLSLSLPPSFSLSISLSLSLSLSTRLGGRGESPPLPPHAYAHLQVLAGFLGFKAVYPPGAWLYTASTPAVHRHNHSCL